MRRLSGSLTRALAGAFLWLVISAAAIGFAGDNARAAVGWSALALVVMATFAEPIRRADLVAAAAGALVFVIACVLEPAIDGRSVLHNLAVTDVLITTVALAATPFALRPLVLELDTLVEQLQRQSDAIDDLTVKDTTTGAFRPRHIDTLLTEEIDRARRYHRSLTLAIVSADGWSAIVSARGEIGAHTLTARIVEQLAQGTRTVDKIVQLGEGEFALVLPETPLEGAEVLATRVQASASDETGVLLRVGLANFPRDAVTALALTDEARAALEYARSTNLFVVDRTLLGHGT